MSVKVYEHRRVNKNFGHNCRKDRQRRADKKADRYGKVKW